MKIIRLLVVLIFPLLGFSQGSGQALMFNGIDEFIDVGDEVANGCRTIELWFKPTTAITSSLASPISLISRDFNNGSSLSINEFSLFFAPSGWPGQANGGRLLFLRRDGTVGHQIGSDDNYWAPEHWYHVCATIDPVAGMKLYLNGVEQQETSTSTAPIGVQSGSITDKVSIGRWGNMDIRYFRGEMDEVRFRETERSQQEIREKMCSILHGNESGLCAYWNFDEWNGTILTDHGENSYNGVLHNMGDQNWNYSGAPLGDISAFYYGDFNGIDVNLSSAVGDLFSVGNINSSVRGIQIYKVESLPNSMTNLTSSSTGNYYGVFLTSLERLYDIYYDYDAYSCSSCDQLFTRNDNAHLSWHHVMSTGTGENCSISASDQSSEGFDYRGEYIIGSVNLLSISPLGNDSIVVDYLSLPQVNLGEDTAMCEGESIVLTANAFGDYSWSTGSSEESVLVYEFGDYFVTVTNECGAASDTIKVEDLDCFCTYYVPNSFTPDGNNVNEKFGMIYNCDLSDFRMSIFNSFGKIVFESSDPDELWDGVYNGKYAPQGVFTYQIRIQSENGIPKTVTGHVNLLR